MTGNPPRLEEAGAPEQLQSGDVAEINETTRSLAGMGQATDELSNDLHRQQLPGWRGHAAESYDSARANAEKATSTDSTALSTVSTALQRHLDVLRYSNRQTVEAWHLFHTNQPPPAAGQTLTGAVGGSPGQAAQLLSDPARTLPRTGLGLDAHALYDPGELDDSGPDEGPGSEERQQAREMLAGARTAATNSARETAAIVRTATGQLSDPEHPGAPAPITPTHPSSTTTTAHRPTTTAHPGPTPALPARHPGGIYRRPATPTHGAAVAPTTAHHGHVGHTPTTPDAGPSTVPAAAGPPTPIPTPVPGPRSGSGDPPVVCEPATGPVGGFSAAQWNKLSDTDPRRHRHTATVEPPRHGHHDTLFDLAARSTGDGNNWPAIVDLNRGLPQPSGHPLINPSLIHPGQVFAVPDSPTNPASAGFDPSNLPGGSDRPGGSGAPAAGGPAVFAGSSGHSGAMWGALAGAGGVGLVVAAALTGNGRASTSRYSLSHQDNSTHNIDAIDAIGAIDDAGVLDGEPYDPDHTDPDHTDPDHTDPEHTDPEHTDPEQVDTGQAGELNHGGADRGRPSQQPNPRSGISAVPAHEPRAGEGRFVEWEPVSAGGDHLGQYTGRGLAVVPEPLPELDQAQLGAVLVELGRAGEDTITVDLAELHGLDLAGPGGPAATRAVLAQLHHHSDPACRATVLLSRRHAERLLGHDADLDNLAHTGALSIHDTLDELLDHVELELLRRGRLTLETRLHPHDTHDDDEDVDAGPPEAWVIFAKPASETHHRRLAALISMGAAHRITALLTTDHTHTGAPGATACAAATTLTLAPDGTITHARGEHGQALRAVHLLTATRDATLDLLTTPPEPPTTNPTHNRGGLCDQPGRPAPGSETTTNPAGQKAVEHTETMSSITAALDPYLASTPATTAPAAPAVQSTPPLAASTAGSTLAPAVEAPQEREQLAGADRSSSPVVVTSEPRHTTPAAAAGVDRAGGDPAAPPVPDDALVVLRCFGPRLTVHARGIPGAALVDITDRLSPKKRLLLAVLAASLTGVLTDDLLEAAWPDVALRSARSRLHTTIAQIRQILRLATNTDYDWILLIQGGESYRLDPKIWVDHREFTEALRTARGALSPAETATALRTAITLHSGPFAADLKDPWVDTHRHHTTDQHTAAVHELLDHHGGELTITDQTAILAQAFRDNPTHHATTVRLVRAYLADRQPDRARHVYDQHTQHLDTLDLTPHPSLTALLPTTDTTHRAS